MDTPFCSSLQRIRDRQLTLQILYPQILCLSWDLDHFLFENTFNNDILYIYSMVEDVTFWEQPENHVVGMNALCSVGKRVIKPLETFFLNKDSSLLSDM